MQQRIGVAVEIERRHADLGAERVVEGRRRLAPGAVDMDFRETVRVKMSVPMLCRSFSVVRWFFTSANPTRAGMPWTRQAAA